MFSNQLKNLRLQNKMTQRELAERLGVSQQMVTKYEAGKASPGPYAITRLANIFGVSTDLLLGSSTNTKSKGLKIPVLGYVRAGIPVEAITDILDYEEIPQEMAERGEYFALMIKGDSMAPTLIENDVIIVRKQPDVNNGEIAVVLVNGDDATVKKVHKQENGISLVPINPTYSPIFFTNEDVINKPVSVIGKMVELRRKF